MEIKSYFIGLSGFTPDFDCLDLGNGILVRKTYAHIMAHGIAAFAPPPEKPKKIGNMIAPRIHPGPWKNLEGGFAYDINAEIQVPDKIQGLDLDSETTCDALVGLIRLSVRPQIFAPAISLVSFSEAAQDPNFEARLYEVSERYFSLHMEAPEKEPSASFEWLQFHLIDILRLIAKDSTLRGAIEIITGIQFIKHRGLAMVSVWAALESIFKIDTEIRHRVSAYIATFLEPIGQGRLDTYHRCMKLYKSRCSAAHAGRQADPKDLLDSVVLLRRVIIRIIEQGKMPSASDIESAVFADSSNAAAN